MSRAPNTAMDATCSASAASFAPAKPNGIPNAQQVTTGPLAANSHGQSGRRPRGADSSGNTSAVRSVSGMNNVVEIANEAMPAAVTAGAPPQKSVQWNAYAVPAK